VAGETAREHAREQERLLKESSDVLGVSSEDLPSTVSRFFEEWKSQQKKIESLEAEIVRLRTSGGGEGAIERGGIRYAIMEVDGSIKALMSMLGELTRDPSMPTLAVLGTREGGGKIIVGITEGTIASEAHNAVEILNSIATHIDGGGGGSPTMAQGGGSKSDGVPAALDSARELLGL
jgi:alanyl-tRNA synthetase